MSGELFGILRSPGVAAYSSTGTGDDSHKGGCCVRLLLLLLVYYTISFKGERARAWQRNYARALVRDSGGNIHTTRTREK